MKRKEVQLEDIKVTVSILKYGKVKKIVAKFAELITGFISLLDTEDDSELSKSIIKYIQDNISEVEKVLFEFTDLTEESIEELYITDFVKIFDETLSLYGMDRETVMGFFQARIPQRMASPE